jgi:hypothetical protein
LPKISVLTVSGRELYQPYQIAALKMQTFKDFEWVFVDDLYDTDKEKIAGWVGGAFPVTHLHQKDVVDYFAVGAGHNDGFARCKGELIFFMIDYCIPEIHCLERHWALHEKYPKAYFSGSCYEMPFKPSDQPTAAVLNLPNYRINLFTSGYHHWSHISDGIFSVEADGVQDWWGGRGDSAPLEAILECNGIDERLDGGHGYHDDDMAQRMRIAGYQYLIDTKAIVLSYPHIPGGGKKVLRSDIEQQWFKSVLIPERIKMGIYRVNPHRDIRQEREEWLSGSNVS